MRQRTIVRRAVSVAAKDVLLGQLYPFEYNLAIRKPVNERKVVFLEGRLDEMPDSFTQVWRELERRGGYELKYLSLRRRSVAFPQYVANCIAAVREIATAKHVFLCDASDLVSCLPLRPATKVVQLWHACGAFKKWGMSTADKLFGGSGFEKERHPFYENLSLVTVSSPEVEWAYREAMALEDDPGIVQPLGVSRSDVFFDEGFLHSAEETVHRAVPGIGKRKIILYAPTFRGTTGHAEPPRWLNVPAMARALGGEYALLIKHHPYVSHVPKVDSGCADFAFNVGDMPIDELLSAADVCITDYSSIVFEYSLFERPMAFFAPDIADYDDWRGFYYDYDELTPGPVFTQTGELIDWLQDVDSLFERDKMVEFRKRFMGACDGHATGRVLAYLEMA